MGAGPGQTVVVVGATGGVGSFVTQMAAARGARVVAVSATPGVALSSELGATETIDHEAVDVGSTLRTRYPAGVDTLITMYGDVETVTGMAQSVRTGGLVVSPAMRADAVSSTFEKLGVTFTGVSRLSPARLPELTTLLDAGKLRVPPVTAFQLERAGDAIGEMATGHVRGKLVIAIS